MNYFVLSLAVSIICLCSAAPGRCDNKVYDDTEVEGLAEFGQAVMAMTRAEYAGKPFPAKISKKAIAALAAKNYMGQEQLKLLETYDMAICSKGKELGAVAWDPATGRKLFQDLYCTTSLDDPAWKNNVFGKGFTLDWGLCELLYKELERRQKQQP